MDSIVVDERYILTSKIGKGGFASVYLGTDKITKHLIAIKFLKYDTNDVKNEKSLIMFKQEAMAMAAISHKNVCKVFDTGVYMNNPYIVMDYIKGQSLKDVIAIHGFLLVDEVYTYMLQILDGLQACHNANIIHRDIKPQNIILESDGNIVLCDFGTAFINSEEVNLYKEDGQKLALTVQYMAPDFKNNPAGSVQTDIYALGISMFEMFAGRCPFNAIGENRNREIIQMQMNSPLPSVRKINPKVPESFENIIYKCCEKDPKKRYKSCMELKAAIIQAYQEYKNPVEKKKQSFWSKLWGKKK